MIAAEPQWSRIWDRRGALRDFRVSNTTAADWAVFVFQAKTFPHEYLRRGQPAPMPPLEEMLGDGEGEHLLRVLLGEVTVESHFLTADEVVYDVDPMQVQTRTAQQEVRSFAERVASAMGKSVRITVDGKRRREELASYQLASRQWTEQRATLWHEVTQQLLLFIAALLGVGLVAFRRSAAFAHSSSSAYAIGGFFGTAFANVAMAAVVVGLGQVVPAWRTTRARLRIFLWAALLLALLMMGAPVRPLR